MWTGGERKGRPKPRWMDSVYVDLRTTDGGGDAYLTGLCGGNWSETSTPRSWTHSRSGKRYSERRHPSKYTGPHTHRYICPNIINRPANYFHNQGYKQFNSPADDNSVTFPSFSITNCNIHRRNMYSQWQLLPVSESAQLNNSIIMGTKLR